jgi:RNA polymerase sigma-70 factor (ECF subfamily)
MNLSPAKAEMATEDNVWIRETLDGNQEAFGCLVMKYKDRLFDFASRMMANPAEAEDVLQESFLDAYRHLADFNHRAKFSTWLYSIVINHVRNRLRHNRVIQWFSLDAPRLGHDEQAPAELPARGPSFDSKLEHKLDLESIQQAVRRMPVAYQVIFIQHYFQDVSIEEIARRMDRPIGTVKVYLHRARKWLFKQYLENSPQATLNVLYPDNTEEAVEVTHGN